MPDSAAMTTRTRAQIVISATLALDLGVLRFLTTLGHYRANLREGTWIELFPAGGKRSECAYIAGARSGLARVWIENGTLISETNFDTKALSRNNRSIAPAPAAAGCVAPPRKPCRLPASARLASDDGCSPKWTCYSVTEPNLREGDSREWWPNGKLKSELHWSRGLLSTAAIESSAKGAKEGGDVASSTPGPCRTWHQSGALESEACYSRGEFDGLAVRYYDGAGMEFRANYASGKRQGEFASWYPDGKPAKQGLYLDNHEQGAWKFWSPDGELDLVRSGNYANGVRVGD